jgi:hypothetical protein
MKVENSKVVRWVAKLIGGASKKQERAARPIELSKQQLHQVSGGSGESAGTPYKGW